VNLSTIFNEKSTSQKVGSHKIARICHPKVETLDQNRSETLSDILLKDMLTI